MAKERDSNRERCGSAVGRKLVGGPCLVHNAERVEEKDKSKSRAADPLSVLHVTISLVCGK